LRAPSSSTSVDYVLRILIATIAVVVAGCGGAQPSASTATVFDLDGVVGDFVGGADGGAVVLTVRRGEVTVSAVGVADATGTPLTAEMPFRVGSVSKPLVATIVLQMVDEGAVDLDQSLAVYLPDTPVGGEVSVRALLSHQSGIANYTDQRGFFPDVFGDRTRTFSPEEVLGYVAEVPGGSAGEFSYSNTNYILLGQLIEAVDGVTLNNSLQTRIAEPLGLNSTVFAGRGVDAPDGLVGGWSPDVSSGDARSPYESVASSAWAAGSLVSTAADLEDFLTALFSGELISPDALAAMTDTSATGYGLGLFEPRLIGLDSPGYAHNGSFFGYSAFVDFSPNSGDTIVILTNNDQLVADELAGRILTNW